MLGDKGPSIVGAAVAGGVDQLRERGGVCGQALFFAFISQIFQRIATRHQPVDLSDDAMLLVKRWEWDWYLDKLGNGNTTSFPACPGMTAAFVKIDRIPTIAPC